MNINNENINRYVGAILVVVFLLVSCATMNIGDVPFAKWSPKQKANFFMTMWESQKVTYDMMDEMTDKPADLMEVLQVKYQILEKSRIPVRTYANIVKTGGVPNQNSEDEIMKWLRQLQLQLVYSR